MLARGTGHGAHNCNAESYTQAVSLEISPAKIKIIYSSSIPVRKLFLKLTGFEYVFMLNIFKGGWHRGRSPLSNWSARPAYQSRPGAGQLSGHSMSLDI